ATALSGNWQRDQEVTRYSLQTRWRLTERLLFEGGVYTTSMDLRHPISLVIDQQSDNLDAFGRFDWEGELGGMRADLYFGASYREGELTQQLYTNLGNAVRGFQFGDAQQEASGLDLFAESRLFVRPRLALVA